MDSGILRREQYSDAPERFDYHLTHAGHALVPVLRSLYAWGERWACTPGPGVASTPRSARA